MEQIRANFEKTTPLSDADWLLFCSKLEEVHYKKKTLLLTAGQTENYLYFIQKGITRFYIPGEAEDLTFGFTFQDNFVSAYDSFLTQTPSTYSVEALTDVVVWRISYADMQVIYLQSLTGNSIGRHAGEALFLEKTKREISLLKDSAQERYLNLFKEQPQLLQYIPLKYIASYIGITPQALSRIRRRIT